MNTTKSSMEEQLIYLKNLPDDQIDTSDIPEVKDFSNFAVGKYYRPIKKPITLRLDADVLDWFKKNNPKYQSAINSVLRKYVMEHIN